jgi:UDP-N-acetylmuramoyl-tripeptide--D-alanyl-D-alanine ligase
MFMNSLSSYAAALQIAYTGQDVIFSSISTDTRTLKPGALFIALKGPHFDGHHYIDLAFQKGAVAALVEKPINANLPHLKVADTRRALGLLAKYHRSQFSVPLIALTGSCGKTTTKELLSSILSQCGQVLASERSFNNDIGMPLTLLKLNKKHDFVVLEMGANAPGEIAWLTHIAKPHIAMILNIAPAHLEGFGSIEKVAQAKSEIFQGLSEKGIAIVHSSFITKWAQHLPKQRTLCFGLSKHSIVSAHSIALDELGCAYFSLVTDKASIPIHLGLPGAHQVDNAMAAASAALMLNIPLKEIKRGLEAVKPISGRLVTVTNEKGTRILDDTYNANPSSMRAALSVLAHFKGKRILVLGDMGELGEASSTYHTQVGEWARDLNIHALFTYGEASHWAATGFGEGAIHFSHQQELIDTLKGYLNAEHTVLIKGSRSAGMEKVVHALTKHAN